MQGINEECKHSALLGLHDWRTEAFYTGLHADYLQNKYPDVEIGLSLPRIIRRALLLKYFLKVCIYFFRPGFELKNKYRNK